MPITETLVEIAGKIKAAQDEARSISPITADTNEFDLPAAYAVAEAVHRERIREGAVPVGRKIGFTNSAIWPTYGIHEPIWGRVYDTTTARFAGETFKCSLAKFAEPRIEPEIMLHFRSAPQAGGDLASILDCVDWIAHGFEIVQSHFPGWKFRAPDAIADGGLHARLLVGPPQAAEKLGANLIQKLEGATVSIFCDGTFREKGKGGNALGSPLRAVSHLRAVLENQTESEPIQPGELITTGTLTAAFPVWPGERWHTEVEGLSLPGVAVEFE